MKKLHLLNKALLCALLWVGVASAEDGRVVLQSEQKPVPLEEPGSEEAEIPAPDSAFKVAPKPPLAASVSGNRGKNNAATDGLRGPVSPTEPPRIANVPLPPLRSVPAENGVAETEEPAQAETGVKTVAVPLPAARPALIPAKETTGPKPAVVVPLRPATAYAPTEGSSAPALPSLELPTLNAAAPVLQSVPPAVPAPAAAPAPTKAPPVRTAALPASVLMPSRNAVNVPGIPPVPNAVAPGTKAPGAEEEEDDDEGPPGGVEKQVDSVSISCIKPEVMAIVKKAGAFFNQIPIITSGYRPGGRRGSFHRKCMAVDFIVPGISTQQVAAYLKSLPEAGGVGTYCHTRAVHIDTGEPRNWGYCGFRRTYFSMR